MADHNENALNAAIKALNEVVAPSVERTNPLAVEQLRLVSLYLSFHVQQREQERRLAWTQLHLQVRLAQEAAGLVAGSLPAEGAALRAAAQSAQELLQATASPAAQWERAHGALGEQIAQVQAAAQGGAPALRTALDRLVLAHAQGQLLLHRVWFKSFGFEARPDSLPTLDAALAAAPDI